MQLTVRFFGLEFLFVDLSDPLPIGNDDTATDCTTYPLGFVPSAGDQRWESCPDLE